MPPMTSAFDRQLSALPLSVEPPHDDPYEPHPLDMDETRNLVRFTWPQVGTMASAQSGRMSQHILRRRAQSGETVSALIAEQGQVGELGMVRGDLAAERVESPPIPHVDWTRTSSRARRWDRTRREMEAVPYPDDNQFDPDDNLSFDLRQADADAGQAEAVLAKREAEAERERQRRAAEAEREHQRLVRGAREADQVARAALQDQRSQIPSATVSAMLYQGSAAVQTEPSQKPLMQPIFEPLHNAREIAKQLVMLEDHLAHPSRRCHDCIRKHLLTAEGLADEAVTLDESGEHRDRVRKAAQDLRDIAKVFTAGGDRDALQSRVRELRKQMSKDGFSAMEDRTPEYVNADPPTGPAPSAGAPPLKAPARGSQSCPTCAGAMNVAGGCSSCLGSMNTALGAISPGAMIAYPSGGSWLPGQVVKVEPSGLTVRAIHPGSYGSAGASGSLLRVASVLPMARSKISDRIRGKKVWGYRPDGTTISGTPLTLKPEQLFFADLIQAVFNDTLSDACRLVGVAGHAQSGGGCQNVLDRFAEMAIVTAWYESRFNPTVSNTKSPDDSWGLFQLNRKGGLGRGVSPATLLNPVENSRILANEIKRRISLFSTLIKREAALQPTLVGDWINIFTTKIQLPASPMLSGQARAKTGNQLFPGKAANALQVASQPAPSASPQGAPSASPEAILATGGVLQQGRTMTAKIFSTRYPQEGQELTAVDEAAIKLTERATPIDLDSADAQALRRAARAWLGAGRRTGSPPAAMRSAYLYRLCMDMKGYVDALRVVRIQTAGSTLATEADRLILEALQTSPDLADGATDPKLEKTGGRFGTTEKVLLAGAFALSLTAGFAFYSSRQAAAIEKRYQK
jgi:hypothetical protein